MAIREKLVCGRRELCVCASTTFTCVTIRDASRTDHFHWRTCVQLTSRTTNRDLFWPGSNLLGRLGGGDEQQSDNKCLPPLKNKLCALSGHSTFTSCLKKKCVWEGISNCFSGSESPTTLRRKGSNYFFERNLFSFYIFWDLTFFFWRPFSFLLPLRNRKICLLEREGRSCFGNRRRRENGLRGLAAGPQVNASNSATAKLRWEERGGNFHAPMGLQQHR